VFLHAHLASRRVASDSSNFHVQWASCTLAEIDGSVIPVTSESLLTRLNVQVFSGSSAWRGNCTTDILEGSTVWDRLMGEIGRGFRQRSIWPGDSVLLFCKDLTRLLVDCSDVALLYETEGDVLFCTSLFNDQTALFCFDKPWASRAR